MVDPTGGREGRERKGGWGEGGREGQGRQEEGKGEEENKTVVDNSH